MEPLRVLVACEFSGVVRRAFAALGHDTWSCDLLPAEDRSNKHYVGDAREILELLQEDWDLLMVAHPPCTRLCNSGVRWLKAPPPGRSLADIWHELDEGAALFSAFWNAKAKRIAVENPVMHRYAKERIANYAAPAQSIQPWQFGGTSESKRTCFWLRNLAPLKPNFRTWDDFKSAHGLSDDAKPAQGVHMASPGPERWKARSRFFPGVAEAMAMQWGGDARFA